VLGVLPGADPDPAVAGQVVVVGAHLDHLGRTPWSGAVFRGADDNASGTAVMLELARAFAGSATRPRRTLLFAAWNAEERGLLGSCHYTDVDPRFPLAATVAALSVDMVGQGSGTGLELYGTDVDPVPRLSAVTAGAASLAGLAYQVSAPGSLEASDHVCFAYQGVPSALAYAPGPHEGYHTPADLPERVTARNLDAAGKLLFGLVRAYAMGDEGRFAAAAPAPMARAPGPAPAAARASIRAAE
jgi:Zn-dependent M28 family amino/carboxypeptidase